MSTIPERDPTKPAEQQGLFRKFIVERTDGSSAPGGKHAECETFVLDVDHDPHAKAALAAYADAVEVTHPVLASDLRKRYGLPGRGWSNDRRTELGRLERLLRDVAGLNNTTRFLDVTRKCIDEAKALVERDFDSMRDPFVTFVMREACGFPERRT